MAKKILIIGSGGREHALVQACAQSALVSEVVVAPGNEGMAEARRVPVDAEDAVAVVALAQAEAADLVIIGPEAPLAAGAADALRAEGFLVYGPGAEGAQLEASKAFSKDFMVRHGIPTARARSFRDFSKALEYLHDQAYPLVIKASGLAAGKGVIICPNFATAELTARDMLVRHKFRESGHEILVEEFMDGEEASIMLMVSGTDYIMLPASQDHKRIGEGDTGPNTGGMGAYAPAACVTPEIQRKVVAEIIEPTLQGLRAEGIDYRGTLYIGIMIEQGQPKVVEYNVRFGDPECQILLPLLASDPVALFFDCAQGNLKPSAVPVRPDYAMIVTLAAEGYPAAYRKGDAITLPDILPEGASILHAGTTRNERGQLVTNGGRVLGCVGTGSTLQAARDQAYAVAEQVRWEGVYFRRDIGWRQLQREG